METPKSETLADGYLVLQGQNFLGPFRREELEEGWPPMRIILRKLSAPAPVEAPGWFVLLRWIEPRIWKEIARFGSAGGLGGPSRGGDRSAGGAGGRSGGSSESVTYAEYVCPAKGSGRRGR